MQLENKNIPPIFKDIALQKQFDELGFVKVQLLTEVDIELLKKIFYSFHQQIENNSFGASTFLNNQEQKHKIRDALYPVFLPHFEKIFINYSYFGSSFLYKTKGKNSELAPHQDWTIVDEKKYVALNIWTPLIDTTSDNGTLYVVPKSQAQNTFVLRAPTIQFYYQKYFDTVIKCAIPTNAKAGEAVILNQSIIHYSSPNLLNDIRIAITSGLKTKEAPMLFHYKNEKNDIEQYEMPEDFLLDFDDFSKDIYKQPSKGKFIKNIEYKHTKISELKFIEYFGKDRFSFFSKMKKIFR